MRTNQVTGKTQGAGAFNIALQAGDKDHQIQAVRTGGTAVGTLAITGKTPGAPGFSLLGTINLSAGTADHITFSGHFAEIRVTPTAVDATSYAVYTASS